MKPAVLGWLAALAWIGVCLVPAALAVGARAELGVIMAGVVIGLVASTIAAGVTHWAQRRYARPIPPK